MMKRKSPEEIKRLLTYTLLIKRTALSTRSLANRINTDQETARNYLNHLKSIEIITKINGKWIHKQWIKRYLMIKKLKRK